MEEAKEFKVGDRVYWKGNYDNHWKGDSGVITSFMGSESAWVLWDSASEEYWIDLLSLKHEQPKDKPEEHPITFYNIQDYIPVGGFAKAGNEVYKVVKEEWCVTCEFMGMYQCRKAQCTSNVRSDGTSVSFILYDTIPEDNDEQP